MAQHFVVTPDGKVRSYAKKSQADAMAVQLTGAVVATEEHLKDIPTAVLITLHNIIRPEKPVTRFSDRATAEKRMKGVLEVLATPGELPEGEVNDTAGDDAATATEGEDMAAGTKGARKRAAKKGGATKRAAKTTEAATAGRPSKYAGMKIVKIEKKNPRKEGTSGHASWEVLRSGMLYEDYIAAGGVRRDLEWDLEREWVKLEKA